MHERATASLRDPMFVLEHGARLGQAVAEAKVDFPGEKAGSDEARRAAMDSVHRETMRLHLEQEAIDGDPKLQDTANFERRTGEFRRDGLANIHDRVMDRLGRAQTDAAAIAEIARQQGIRDAAAQSRGFASEEVETAHHEAEQARATRADEDAAINAGHVSGEAREIGDRYEAAIAEHQRAAEGHADALDRAHGEAADALAKLHEYSHDEHEGLTLEHATPALAEEFSASQSALHEAIGRGDHEGYERESSHRELPVHPDEAAIDEGERYVPYQTSMYGDPHVQAIADSENARFANHPGLEMVSHPGGADDEGHDAQHAHQLAEHEAWAKRAEAAYNEAIAAHTAEFKGRASLAQDALERLHEQQIAAHDGLKASSTAAGKARREAEKQIEKIDPEELVNEKAFEHHATTEEGEIVDSKAADDYDRAHRAAESTLDHASTRIDEHGFNAGDALDPLKQSLRATRDAIKELAEITGRAPRGDGKKPKPAKKSAPDVAARKAEWEEDKHPRGHGGKFTEGSGGAGHGDDGEDHEARANEHEAIAAGHVSSMAKDIADQYVAGHQAREAKVADHTVALDALHHDAAHALAALHEYSSPHNEDLDFEHHGLHERFTETQGALDPERTGEYASGSHQREAPIHPDEIDHEGDPSYRPHPRDIEAAALAAMSDEDYAAAHGRALSDEEYDRHLAAHEAWKTPHEARYNAEFEPHYAEYQRRADAAQSALEALHERQVSAHADLRHIDDAGGDAHAAATKELERMSPEKQVNEAAFAHHARDEHGEIDDEGAARDHAAAHDAAESMHEHATARVEEHTHSDLGDALESLKHETRATAAALKDLGKITGRKPRLPAKVKKFADRPWPEALAQSCWMRAAADLLAAIDAVSSERGSGSSWTA